MKGETYEEFVEKFKGKKTTDDCYTPAAVYDVVADYVAKYYNKDRNTFCRPFYPGGDYKKEDYSGRIVVDNPPFSILTEIIRYYTANSVPFFLFAPGLTAIKKECCCIIIRANIIYKNGAKVRTCFLTNLEDNAIRTDPELSVAIAATNENKTKPATELPDNVVTSARLLKYGGNKAFTIPREDCEFIRKYNNKALYGPGYILKHPLEYYFHE